MTTDIVGVRHGSDRLRVGVSPTALAIGGVALLTIALAVITWGTWGDLNSDTGYDVVAGARVAHGALPYRDFIYYYGPLAPAVAGLASLVGGAGFWPLVVVGFPVALAILALTFVIASILAGRVGAVLATTITAAVAFIPDNFNYVLPHTLDATLGTLLVLAMLLAIWRFAVTSRSHWLPVIGSLVGLALLTKPEPAAAALIATGSWVALGVIRRTVDRRGVAAVVIPAIGIPALVYGTILTLVSPHRLLLENLYPVDVFRAGGNVEVHGRMPLTLTSFVHLGGKLVLYAVGAAAIVLVGRALETRLRRVVLAAIPFVTIAVIAAALVKPEALRHGLQYAYGWIPAAALIAAIAIGWRLVRAQTNWTAEIQLAFAGAVALTALAATTYPGFFPHAPHEQMAAYYMPLAAIFIVCVHLRLLGRTPATYAAGVAWLAFLAAAGVGLTLKDANVESATVHGVNGAISATPAEAHLYRGALAWVNKTTHHGEPIFVAPMMTGIYALSGHESPVQELSMLPDALPHVADEQRTIRALDTAHVRLVITDDRAWPGYGQTTFGASFDRVLATWIRAHFNRVGTVHVPSNSNVEGLQPPRTLSIWVRRGT